MDKISLELQKRDTFGKHNKSLRRTGVTPANLFGHGVHSLALQGPTVELEQTIARSGTSRLINLKIPGEKRARTVLVREIQRKPVTGLLLHVDLYQVQSKEKMTVEVPVHVVGKSPALESKANTLDVELPSLTVECLPAHLPARLEVDISRLETASDVLRVADVVPPKGVTILNDHGLVVVKIEAERRPVVEAEEPEAEPVGEAEAEE